MNGADGGESGWAAAELNFFFAAAMEVAFDDGEIRNIRKPIERTPARMSVIGFVRLNDLGKAMLRKNQKVHSSRLPCQDLLRTEGPIAHMYHENMLEC